MPCHTSIVWLYAIPLVNAQYDTPLNTTREVVGWVYGANYRSTADIIFSCVLTMGLCVWTALHLNIPYPAESRTRQWVRNAGWVGLGIFGPELVMFAAWKQWASARALQTMILQESPCSQCDTQNLQMVRSSTGSDLLERKTSTKTREQRPEWTVLHGYYATMGGFVLELSSDSASIILNKEVGDTRLTITPQGLQLLAECDLIPDIETREILEKNKADGLAKCLVILQASWMLVQSIARLAYHLPITLLEVNTIGHVICALFIYALWWKKPREVTEATVLNGPWVVPMAAYMIMSSDLDETEGWMEWVTLKPPLLPELSNLTLYRPKLDLSRIDEDSNGSNSGPIPCHEPVTFLNHARKTGFGSLGIVEQNKILKLGIKRQESFQHHFDQANLERQTQSARWSLALEAMAMFPHLCCRMQELQTSINTNILDWKPQVMLQNRQSNWPKKGAIPPHEEKVMGIVLWFASIAFGAVHVAAWNEQFPSIVEKWLWRSSSLYLAWAGGLWLSINCLGAVSRKFAILWETAVTGCAHKTVCTLLTPVCFVCGVAYAFARTYLVIEAVISIRALPIRCYWVPDWPQVIPHL